jgi:hypothetical protein
MIHLKLRTNSLRVGQFFSSFFFLLRSQCLTYRRLYDFSRRTYRVNWLVFGDEFFSFFRHARMMAQRSDFVTLRFKLYQCLSVLCCSELNLAKV